MAVTGVWFEWPPQQDGPQTGGKKPCWGSLLLRWLAGVTVLWPQRSPEPETVAVVTEIGPQRSLEPAVFDRKVFMTTFAR